MPTVDWKKIVSDSVDSGELDQHYSQEKPVTNHLDAFRERVRKNIEGEGDILSSISIPEPPVERNIVGETAAALGRGVGKATEYTGRGIQELGGESVGGALRSAGESIQQAEFLAPSEELKTGQAGLARRTLAGAAESIPMSAVPLATAAAGAAIGTVTTANPVGAAIGGLAGGAAGLGTVFYGGTYSAEKERAVKEFEQLHPDWTPEQREREASSFAHKQALWETGTEGVSDLVTAGIGKALAKGIVKEGATGAKAVLRDLLGTGGPKEMAKKFAQVYAAEGGSEIAAYLGQAANEQAYGLGDGPTLTGALDTAVTSLWMTGALGAAGAGMNYAERNKTVSGLNSENKLIRDKAAEQVESKVAEKFGPDSAKQWRGIFESSVAEGKGGGFSIDSPLFGAAAEAYAPEGGGVLEKALGATQPAARPDANAQFEAASRAADEAALEANPEYETASALAGEAASEANSEAQFEIESVAARKRAAGIPLDTAEGAALAAAEQRLAHPAPVTVAPVSPAQDTVQAVQQAGGIATETPEQAQQGYEAYQPVVPVNPASEYGQQQAEVERFQQESAEYNRLSNIPDKLPELPSDLLNADSLTRPQLLAVAKKYNIPTVNDTGKAVGVKAAVKRFAESEKKRIASETRLRTPEEQARLDQLAGRTPERLAAQAARERTAAEQRRFQQAAAELDSAPLKPAPGAEMRLIQDIEQDRPNRAAAVQGIVRPPARSAIESAIAFEIGEPTERQAVAEEAFAQRRAAADRVVRRAAVEQELASVFTDDAVANAQKRADEKRFIAREGEDVAAALPIMMRELSQGTAGRRLRNAGESYGYDADAGAYLAEPSSYPKWVQENPDLSKAGRATIERVAELGRAGGKMTERQIDLWMSLKKAAQKEYGRNPEIQQGVEYERLTADGYDFEIGAGGLLASDLSEGDSVALMEDGAIVRYTSQGVDENTGRVVFEKDGGGIKEFSGLDPVEPVAVKIKPSEKVLLAEVQDRVENVESESLPPIVPKVLATERMEKEGKMITEWLKPFTDKKWKPIYVIDNDNFDSEISELPPDLSVTLKGIKRKLTTKGVNGFVQDSKIGLVLSTPKVTNDAGGVRSLYVLAHEIGHYIKMQHLDTAPESLKREIRSEYLAWKRKNKHKIDKGISIRYDRMPYSRVYGSNIVENMPVGTGKAPSGNPVSEYDSSFDEWFADQVAKVLTASEKPISQVEIFFKEVGEMLRKLLKEIVGTNFMPTEIVRDFVSGGDSFIQKYYADIQSNRNEVPFSKAQAPLKDAADVRAELAKEYGAGWIGRAERRGLLKIVDSNSLKNIFQDGFRKSKSTGNEFSRLHEKWKSKGVDLKLTRDFSGNIVVEKMIVPEGKRNIGVGTSILSDIISIADNEGSVIVLTPAEKSDNFGTESKQRLISFYKRAGFVENKGKTKDYSIGGERLYKIPSNVKLSTDGLIEGFVTPDGQVHLVQGNIAKGQALGVVAHELGSHAMRSGFTKEQDWLDILDQSDRLLARGDESVVEARRRAVEAGTPDSLLREETVAYLSNIAPKHGIIRNLIAKLKQFMINNGLASKLFISKLTAADLQVLAQGATKAAIRGGRKSISRRINEFSQSVKLSVSEAAEKIKGLEKFKEWFGDSEVTDDDYEPLVLYHGTKSDFNIFDKSKLRRNTGHPTSMLGFFFVPDKKEAKVYSGEDGNIVPVYVKIEKPYEINNGEFAERFFDFGKIDPNEAVEEAEYAFKGSGYGYENLYPTSDTGDFSFTEITEDGPMEIGFDDLPSELQDAVNKIAEDTYIYENWSFRDTFSNKDLLEKVNEFKEDLIREGYDGMIISADSSTDYAELNYDTYIAFEPNQIKSIYNTGTWDSGNPDIRFSISKKITPDLRVEATNKKGEPVTRPLSAKAMAAQKPLSSVKEAVETRTEELRSGLTEGDILARKIEEEAQKKASPRRQAQVEKDLLEQVRVFKKQHLKPEIQDMANEIFGAIDPAARRMTPAKETDLKATRAEIERLKAAGADIDPALEAKVARLDRRRIGDMLPGEAQALLDVANELAYVNETKNKLLAVERGQDAAELSKGIIAPIEAKPSKRYAEAKKTGKKAERGKNPILDLGRQLLGDPASTFKTLMLDLGRANEKSSAYRLSQTVSERQNIELRHRRDLDAQLEKSIGKNWQELAESKEWNTEQDVNGRKLTSGEKVYLKYSLNDQNVSDSIEKMGYRKKLDTKATKMSRAEREAIKLNPEEQRVYDALADYFESTYQVLNPAHVEMKGWTLPAAGRGKYLPKSVSNLTLADELGSIIRSGSVENTGVVQDRIGTLNEINLKDIFEVITRQRDIASKYAAYAPMVRDFNLVFRSPELKNTLQMEYGLEKNGKSIVENYVDDLLRDLQGNKVQVESGVDAAVRKIRTNTAGALLAFRLTTPLMQLTGFTRALAHISPQNLAKALRMRGGFEEAAKWNMRAYARREVGIDREIYDNRNQRLIRTGLQGIQKMDELVTGRLWSATKLQTAQETGLRGDELLKETSRRFDAVLDTQGGHTMADLSMTNRTQSELAKMFTIFSSDKFAMLNEIKRGLIIREHTGDWKPLARASAGMVLSAVMAAGVATAVGGAVSGKDKDYEEEFVKNLAGSLPLFDNLVSMFQGFNPSSAGIEAIGDATNAAGRIASLARKQATGETVTAEQYSKALQAVVNSASLAAGVPVKNITDNLGFAKRLALGKDALEQVESELLGLEDFDFEKQKRRVAKGKQGAELRAALSKLRAEFAGLDQEKVAAARRLTAAKKRIKEIDKELEREVPAALRLRRERLREEIAERAVR